VRTRRNMPPSTHATATDRPARAPVSWAHGKEGIAAVAESGGRELQTAPPRARMRVHMHAFGALSVRAGGCAACLCFALPIPPPPRTREKGLGAERGVFEKCPERTPVPSRPVAASVYVGMYVSMQNSPQSSHISKQRLHNRQIFTWTTQDRDVSAFTSHHPPRPLHSKEKEKREREKGKKTHTKTPPGTPPRPSPRSRLARGTPPPPPPPGGGGGAGGGGGR